MLGRRIDYKTLENILQQRRARRGVLNIVDLGKEYYLVTFSCEEDLYVSLMEYYLVTFSCEEDLSCNYDDKFKMFIGNCIDITVNVDTNMFSIERGNYSRLCIQVDLTKPLLVIFSIKEKHYKVEYKGLHLLCPNCGRFWHYKEGEKEGSHGKTKSILESIMEEKCLNEAVTGLNLDEGIHEEFGLVKIDSGYDIRVRHNQDQLVPKEFIAQGSIDENNGNFTP
ncbi:hypothetical protein KIW84_043269 [Lathyrus oleraceus]|uniref:Uncharacterized protein n=1 Tax=Pisum sativum TaxID=3888 RepID=A0A9D5ANW0_PEA|nr:hypothetical protein KIW84_043269 [Pisum sativum]